MDGKKSLMLRIVTNTIAFVVLIAIAALLVVARVSGQSTNLSAVCIELSRLLAYLLVGLASFWYVMSKRNVVLKVVWVICFGMVLVLTLI